MMMLYHNEISSSSQKVRLCLAEKELSWESRAINLASGEHQQDWYRTLNPRAVVPTLVDGAALQESTVINEYLEERYPARPLMPEQPMERARVRLWTKQVDDSVHDGCIAVLAFAVAFREQLLERREAALVQLNKIPDVIKRERRRDVLERGLDSIHVRIAILRLAELFSDMDAALTDAEWLVGERYTLADLSMTPYLTRLDDLALDCLFNKQPRIVAWFERCRSRPSYTAAIADWNIPGVLAHMKRSGERCQGAISDLAQKTAP